MGIPQVVVVEVGNKQKRRIDEKMNKSERACTSTTSTPR